MPSIADLPEKVDLFVVAVGAPQVPEVVSELIEHDRANAVILIPGGLGEKEGSQELELQLKAKIADAHLRGDGGPVFLGGNSLGVVSHPGRYDTLFIPESKLAKSRGEQATQPLLLQPVGSVHHLQPEPHAVARPGLRPVASATRSTSPPRTCCDSSPTSPQSRSSRSTWRASSAGDGLAFADAVREAVAAGKDVVFYKAGRTSEGRSATAGHTASVAGDYAVCEAALAEAGALVASDFGEFSDFLRLALRLRGKTIAGTGLAAMSNAGFESVGMADSIRQDGAELKLVGFSAVTVERLAETCRGTGSTPWWTSRTPST